MKINSKNSNTDDNIIVFDIGGTWFRGAVLSKDSIRFKSKMAAINFKNHPEKTIEELHDELVQYFISETANLKKKADIKGKVTVGISMGAALNGFTGEILNSGPLWGIKSKPLDLLQELNLKQADINWTILNDVTAGLIRHTSSLEDNNLSRIMLITISTGIAARTYDKKTDEVPLTREYGVQGEIGHIPIHFSFRDNTIELFCDCGGKNHLNAFSSGRGIENVLKAISSLHPNEYSESLLSKGTTQVPFEKFISAIQKNDTFALEILDAVTYPLAQILINAFTIDASLDLVLLTGGVIHSLKEIYLESLLKNLIKIGFYQISDKDPDFFRKRIRIVPDDDAGLIGAGNFARTKPQKHNDADGQLIWNVSSPQTVAYTISEEPNLFLNTNTFLYEQLHLKYSLNEVIVIIDSNINKLYGEKISSYFQNYGIKAHIIPISVSEDNKIIDKVLLIERELDKYKIKRRDPIIGIGGGVLLDIVGLAASLYRRGIPYIRIPTTLLSLIDAGIGVKTAVNFNTHKNRLGTYYAAIETYLDKTFLKTLDERNICNGLAEILKIGIVKDSKLFSLLENNAEELIEGKFQRSNSVDMVISRSVTGMLEELEPNLWEHNLERLVDFGHTFGPAIEIAALPELLHGETVAIDMVICSFISNRRGLLSDTNYERIVDLTRRLRLPLFHKACTLPLLMKGLEDTTSHRGGYQRIPIPTSIGEAIFLNDVTQEEISYAIKELEKLTRT